MKTGIILKELRMMGMVMVAATLMVTCTKDDEGTDNEGSINFNSDLTYGTVKDIDGNVYKTIDIGSQTWMAENLKAKRYSNGDSISYVEDNTEWFNAGYELSGQTYGAWSYYNHAENMEGDYGLLYNWQAVTDYRNICPSGWHVPDDADWETLFEALDGYEVAGAKMKETGTRHWAFTNEGATNESGFTALPGGLRYYDGGFTDMGLAGFWWSATPTGDYYGLEANYIYLNRDLDPAEYGWGTRGNGLSCRCVKD